MGLVRVVVDAGWNSGCSAERVSVDWVRVRDYSSCCVRSGFSAGSLSALPTVLSEEDDARFLGITIVACFRSKSLEWLWSVAQLRVSLDRRISRFFGSGF